MQPTVAPLGAWSPGSRIQPQAQPPALNRTILVVASDADLPTYVLPTFQCVVARTNVEVVSRLAREHPVAVVIDADLPELDAAAACAAARSHEDVSVLVTAGSPQQAPAVIKAGCHGVLMKPFAPNLLAARLGRLVRASSQQLRRPDGTRIKTATQGTNRAWEIVTCPRCSEPHAVSFDFTSRRGMWFACLSCNQVWIGPRQE